MKIAIITSGFLPVLDGVTVSGLYRLEKLSQWGHQVLLFCPDYSPLAEVYPNWQKYTGKIFPGVQVINLTSTQFMDLDFERNVSKKSYKHLLTELAIFRPDLIHVDEPERLFLGFWSIPGIDYAKNNNIPCLGFFRTNFLEYLDDYFTLPDPIMSVLKYIFKKLLAWIYNSYDVTLIHSQITHQKLIEMGIKNTIYENLNGFDDRQFTPNLRRPNFFKDRYNQPKLDRQIKIIFLGRLTPDKGWNFTLEAFAKVAQQIDLNNIALIVAGDGPMKEKIANELSNFSKNLHLLGRVPPEDIPALLANSDLHVTTSEKENRALTIIEALAAGLPILAPRAGGIVQDIQNGWNGYLFNPQDINDFVEKLKILIENHDLRKAMGINGKQYISKYSWDNTVRNLLKIWQEQIELKKPKTIDNLTAVK
jgi:glycosyltransferase involved in cell wall biosynthesis